MQRLKSIELENATGKAKELMEGVQKKLGKVPNIYKIMANSPAVLDAQLKFRGAISGGVLPAKLGEQIALLVAELNKCGYCLSAHTQIAKGAGLSDEEMADARTGKAADAKDAAAMEFVKKVVSERANINDGDLEKLKKAGYNDAEIVEIVAHIAINTFTNYFNHVADTEIDFPKVDPL